MDQPRTSDGRLIRTSHECPPIPTNKMDWAAWIDGDEEFGSGHGATEAEAIADIQEKWDDFCDWMKRAS